MMILAVFVENLISVCLFISTSQGILKWNNTKSEIRTKILGKLTNSWYKKLKLSYVEDLILHTNKQIDLLWVRY